MSEINVKIYYLQKCDKLREDIEETRDLYEVNQALVTVNANSFNIQNLIYRMEQKYYKEIKELESTASKFSSNNFNNSNDKVYNATDYSQYQALLRIRFAICFKICKKKCFVQCVEEFMDLSKYK